MESLPRVGPTAFLSVPSPLTAGVSRTHTARQLLPCGAVPAPLLLSPADVLILLMPSAELHPEGPGAGSAPPLKAAAMFTLPKAVNESLLSTEVEVQL